MELLFIENSLKLQDNLTYPQNKFCLQRAASTQGYLSRTAPRRLWAVSTPDRKIVEDIDRYIIIKVSALAK